ncbi:MAG: flagellar FliJ family protein [Acidobacteria bacterium]|nr:flagellar FliJ family protein [Acidobacteriota bacterium]
MRSFVFRAHAALDLRRRRDEDAQRELAAANAAVARAETERDASVQACEQAKVRATDEQRRGGDLAILMWYRNWIVLQRRDIARRHEVVASRRQDAQSARDRAIRTHVDVRVLENLKQRQWRAYTIEVQRAEQKEIDWLAVLRSLTPAAGLEESE